MVVGLTLFSLPRCGQNHALTLVGHPAPRWGGIPGRHHRGGALLECAFLGLCLEAHDQAIIPLPVCAA